MIRHLHPTDTPALFQFKQRSGPDEAYTISRAFTGARKSFPLVRYSSIALSPRAWQGCWVKTRRARVQAVLRAGPRSGPSAWELSELYLAKKTRDIAGEVLEQLAFPAGTSGARRIFLRLSAESDLFDLVRSAGYMPVFSEDVYIAESAQEVLARVGEASGEHELRQLDERDKHALFRLYCAATPMDARSRVGQTFDEWDSATEKIGRKALDWGVDQADSAGLQARVRSSDISGGRYFSVLCANEATCSVESLVATGVSDAGEKKVFTLVPSYDQKLSETLTDLGFTRGTSYYVMVKTLAVTAAERVPGLVVAE